MFTDDVSIPVDRVEQMLRHYYDDTSIRDKYIKPMHIGCERCESDINSFGVPSSVITDVVNNAVNRGKKVEIHTIKSPMPNDDSINLAIYINEENS